MNKKRGFTLPEIITTVAIVGIVTSVAIPSYLQARKSANMEMVRQHMRQVGEKLTEIVGKSGKFPKQEDWWETMKTSADPDEQAITASLSAIDNLCYTTDEYSTNTARTSYRFCSAPKPDSCGNNAGNKRFCVHYDAQMSALFAPGVVGEVGMYDNIQQQPMEWMSPFAENWTTLANGTASVASKINSIADVAKWLELKAMQEYFDYYEDHGHAPSYQLWQDILSKTSYARNIYFQGNDGEWLTQIGDHLQSQGITMIVNKNPTNSIDYVNSEIDFYWETYGGPPSSWPYSSSRNLSYISEGANYYQISYEFNRPPLEQETKAEYVATNPWVQEYCQRNDCSGMGFGS
ncbi:MAG: hypothetical protein A3G33_03065 [Omnitrophica bacterium RIFCSPLOWO2_12_FULL_44_17]|uniref:Type II secretion system protein GspG C-terminal domain-containing protein n=1 Tax=Candidatus Danuiimicrobium aquiferis TaxID=1801832 RepID=A0A1G1KQW2_9BACT|nr:MAG: hypothetical protein A3B72_01820 [Omnitrophica bacterium RIFCSPHIGHO2_02_FULL_45_28]OGW95317.1 MAG: hypothetical protein A3G33_03065 [Omnitrophica bacterium RIFCSPLOWO2_12_FULL_44_17]OGX04720.1 MAG: hypothetical protein A3J12_09095 [Omnitrophica bacterium RIFCSPLOWO2_02_FULL_44_11]